MLQSSPYSIAHDVSLPPGYSFAPNWPANENDLPSNQLSFEEWTTREQLEANTVAWSRLAEMAVEPNPFYEFAAMESAWKHLRTDESVSIIAIWSPPRVNAQGDRVLCGVFPIRKSNRYQGLPIKTIELWRHEQCFLTNPLIRRDSVDEVWQFFLNSVVAKLKAGFISLPMIAADGISHQRLVNLLDSSHQEHLIRRTYYRAMLNRDFDGESYLANQISKKARSETRRLRNKLSEQHTIDWEYFNDGKDLEAWIDEFLLLEKAGWKGEQSTALGCHHQTTDFFRSWLLQLAINGQLQRLSVRCNGRMIAGKVNIVSGLSSFAYKIAYAPEFHTFSPGRLLEIENILRFHETDLLAMDSCADPNHPMIDHLWSGRKPIHSVLIATNRRFAKLALAAYPLMRWCKRSLSRDSK
ncbi:MAG: GNAT family N-acetyltransferase [Pirellulaceae bacterium]